MRSPYDPFEGPGPLPDSEEFTSQRKSSHQLMFFILGLTALSVALRLLSNSAYRSSSLLYIGIPMALALIVNLAPTSGSATGKAIKGTTLALLMVGILLIEGFICILIASPLFYLVAVIIGAAIDFGERRKKNKMNIQCSVIGVLLLMSLEGITESLSFSREETIRVGHETSLSIEQVRTRLAQGPEFDLSQLPLFLKAGFPTPQSIHGQGLALGEVWIIHFQSEHGTAPLTVEVTHATPQQVTFQIIEDETKIGEWLQFHKVEWHFHATPTGTRVEMVLRYDRLLDPAWYFKPVERYGVKKAAEYFMHSTFPQTHE